MSKRREKSKPQPMLNKQLEQPEVKGMQQDENLMQLGKYFYSLSGMTYAGVILTVILNFGDYNGHALYFGFVAMIGFALLGWMTFERGNNKSNK